MRIAERRAARSSSVATNTEATSPSAPTLISRALRNAPASKLFRFDFVLVKKVECVSGFASSSRTTASNASSQYAMVRRSSPLGDKSRKHAVTTFIHANTLWSAALRASRTLLRHDFSS